MIENDHHVSLAVLALVIPQLKVSLMMLLGVLLRMNHPHLQRYGNTLCRLISYIISSKDMLQLSSIAVIAINCFQVLVCRYPLVMSKNPEYGINTIVNLFDEVISQSAAVEDISVDILRKDHALSKCSKRSVIAPSQLLAIIEVILIHCSSTLEPSIRDRIEGIIGRGLVALSKGVSYSYPPGRIYAKKALLEPIRQDADLQISLLNLAMIEIQCYKRSGAVSGNIAVLKRAASTCLHQQETSAVASRALLLIDRLTHHTHISLPSIPLTVEGKAYLSKMESHLDSLTTVNDSLEPVDENFSTAVSGIGERVEVEDVSMKRKREEEARPSEIQASFLMDSSSKGFIALDKTITNPTIGSEGNPSKFARKSAEAVSESSDDLPDINIESDNDS
jgi:hypothetical protein